MIHVCFVCLGNICRSPTAEGILLKLVEDAGLQEHIAVESAGTAGYHVGESADRRAAATARRRGVHLRTPARQFDARDFARFDYILAMDSDNASRLRQLAPTPEDRARVQRLREYEPNARALDVPDPYYGGDRGFEDVFDMCHAACVELLAHIRREHSL